jgi:hypothetical protein
MKRTIIILIALVLFVSLPVFASTPTEENAPIPTSEDGMFLDFIILNEEEMIYINGQYAYFDSNPLLIPDEWVNTTIIVVYNNNGSTTIYEAYDYNNDGIIDEIVDATYLKNYKNKN